MITTNRLRGLAYGETFIWVNQGRITLYQADLSIKRHKCIFIEKQRPFRSHFIFHLILFQYLSIGIAFHTCGMAQ